ncbi:MAG: glycoside hydrolase family 3 N-terminal domain-containing protein [Thermoplasmata archaeon]
MRDINYIPSNYALGKIDKKNISYYAGALTGYELNEIGIRWNLAPVLDTLSNKENFSILERSFSEYVDNVSRNGSSFIMGLQDFGVSATAKHFPGIGSVFEDPHEKLPRDLRNIHSIWNTMKPFIDAINIGVKSIMVSHVLVKEIDQDFPISLSQKSYNLIRKELGYDGILITDSLDMKAISTNYSPNEIAKLAFLGGADILECVDPELAEDIHENMKNINLNNSKREERLIKLYLERKKKFIPPKEIIQIISYNVPKWIRRKEFNPDRDFYIYYAGSTAYMNNIIKRIILKLRELNFSVKEFNENESLNNSQIIIIGKNLHLNGNYIKINEMCKNNECIFINTGIPYDSELLNKKIGYLAAMGDKYENIISSIYSILGLFYHDNF